MLKRLSSEEERIIYVDDYSNLDLSTICTFGTESLVTKAVVACFDVWGESQVAVFCASSAGTLGQNGASVCQRFAAPTVGSKAKTSIDDATWFDQLLTCSVFDKLEKPLAASSYGLPWVFTIRCGTYVGSCSTLPMTVFGGWLYFRAGRLASIVSAPISKTKATPAVGYFHSVSARSVQADLRANKLEYKQMLVGETICIPPGSSIVIATAPKTTEAAEVACAFLWVPYLTLGAGTSAGLSGAEGKDAVAQFTPAFKAARKASNLNWCKLDGFGPWWSSMLKF